MRNLFLIMGCVLLVALSTSCAKKCQCTYFEDGKKVAIFAPDYGEKYFDKADCEYNSEIEDVTDICKVNCENEVGRRPRQADYMKDGNVDWIAYGEAYQTWQKAIDACREANTKKDVKVKVDCKLH